MSESEKGLRRYAKRALRLGIAIGALAAAGLLVALLGVIPVKASSGHLPLMSWFLNLTKERSVARYAGRLDERLDEPWLVLKGAGHYHAGCAPCHGTVAGVRPSIPMAMLPPPPNLAERAPDFEPAELFFIVKHGIKLTGMPAWPADGRDDEVRAVVAFLLALPALDPRGYDALVHGDAAALRGGPLLAGLSGGGAPAAGVEVQLLALCARCHGERGEGRGNAAFPKLAGQQAEYLRLSLAAYRDGSRPSGVMEPLVSALSDADLRAMADAYAAMPASPGRSMGDGAAIERGRRIADEGVPARLVPPCAQCHEGTRNPAYPRLAGQYAEYQALQLELFAAEERGGSPFSPLMDLASHKLTPEERRDVSLYYEALR